MSFEKGWINRQFARIERDAENWPSWMRREMDIRAASEPSCDLSAELPAVGAPAKKPAAKTPAKKSAKK